LRVQVINADVAALHEYNAAASDPAMPITQN